MMTHKYECNLGSTIRPCERRSLRWPRRSTLLVAVLLTASGWATQTAAQAPLQFYTDRGVWESATQALVGHADSEIITFRSGNGTPGGPDNVIRLVAGSSGAPLSPSAWAGPNDAIFDSARNGPFAVLVNTNVIRDRWCGFSSLPADPLAQWIGVNGAADPYSTLFAVPFTINLPNVAAASIAFYYAVDDRLGDDPGPNAFGLYLNGHPVIGSGGLPGSTCSQNAFSANLDPAWLVPNGQNWLYVYDRDTLHHVSGVMFTAAISVEAACAEPPANMVAWWPLDETDGPVAEDIALENDGTWTGAPWSLSGMVDGALCFDGVDDYVSVPNNASLNFGEGDFSIDAWVRTSNKEIGIQPIVDKRTASPLLGYHLFLKNGYLGAQLANNIGDGFSNYISTLFVANGAWHHVAVTVRRGSSRGLTLHVDCQTQSFDPRDRMGSLSNPAPLWIAGRHPIPSSTLYFDGCIDEVEIFNRALAAAEICAIYEAGSAGKCKPPGICCLPNSDCVQATQQECEELQGRYQGRGNCRDISCAPFEGACCLPDGNCVQATDEDCTERLQGRYQGDGTDCRGVDCPLAGACCLPDGTCTDDVPEDECDGRFARDTLCADVDPPCAEQTGACCLKGGLPHIWYETADGGGDAGELLGDAQVPTGTGPLTTITGSRDGDADMFLIRIVDAANFEAKTWPDSDPDTQLFLFDLDGNGVTFNDDDVHEEERLLSRITGQFLPGPGDYYIALSSFDYDPLAGGQEIWEDRPFGEERAPDGPGAPGPVDGWGGAAPSTGAYQIDLIGVEFASVQGGCVRNPEWQCDGDVDGDGQVNPVDSGLVQAAFGSTEEPDLCQYDVDCDGQINPVDSGIVQSLFGTCDAPREECDGGGGDGCDQVTRTECIDLGGEFQGHGTDCDPNPCEDPAGACCTCDACDDGIDEATCDALDGTWYDGVDCQQIECDSPPPPDCPVGPMYWDNNIVPNGFSARAMCGPNFPDIRVVDDFVVPSGSNLDLRSVRFNVVEDVGWVSGPTLDVYIYEGAGAPGAEIINTTCEAFTRIATGDQYFGRNNFDYCLSFDAGQIPLSEGTYWIGFGCCCSGGAGTTYWMTSDGEPDGASSSTGYFSLDAGGSWNPEGAGWHHAFEIYTEP